MTDAEGKIIYVWGLCPLVKYIETEKAPQKYKSHTLSVLLNKPLIPGVSYRLNQERRWPIYINKKKGWVCLGDPNTENKNLVEFAPDCVATLEGENLTAIWLHPEKLPDV